jgi:hypothetical protein
LVTAMRRDGDADVTTLVVTEIVLCGMPLAVVHERWELTLFDSDRLPAMRKGRQAIGYR